MASGTTVRDINRDIIRNCMKGQDAVSKSELASLSGLSFPTVGRTLDLLCREGEVEQVGTGDSSGGRRAALYRLNPLFSVSLMLCVERGQIVWKAGDLEGRTVLEGEEEASGRLMERMGEIGGEIRRRYPQLKAVVIGAAGMVSGGRIRSVGDEELGSGNVEAYFTDLFGVPVKAVNDMNAAAVGRWNRLGKKEGSCVCIYLGKNGIGAGCILDGRIWQGANDFAGELGFLPDMPEGLWPLDIGKRIPDSSVILDIYRRIIQIYAAVLNPEHIVLYENPYLDAGMEILLGECEKAIPEYSRPHLELSGDFRLDYEQGLTEIACRMMEEM